MGEAGAESKALILVVDDEKQIRRFLRVGLEAQGYRVAEVERGNEAIAATAQLHPDLLILDLGLPDMEGFEVLRRLREWTRIPVIILSVRAGEHEKVQTLDAGADDYLTKPFSMQEMTARVRVALRHASGANHDAPKSVFVSGALHVDLAARQISVDGAPIHLTPTEYALLRLLVQHAGKVLTHGQILRAVWGPDYVNETHYLRVYFAQLRQKIEANPTLPQLIITEPGVGYRLVVE